MRYRRSLAWVDMGACLPGVEDLPGFFADEAGVLLEGATRSSSTTRRGTSA